MEAYTSSLPQISKGFLLSTRCKLHALSPNAPKYNPEFFNLFLGFRAQPAERIKPNLVNPIIRHVHEVWCAENKQLTIYILNWLAFLIQNPDKKPGTAIIMRSPPDVEKEIDVKVIDDFAGYMILSNHAMPIRIEMGDERFIALNVSAKYKGNREYFGFLVKVLENPDTASSFMSYLLSRDLTSFNPRSIPDTQIKRELIEANKAKIVENFSKVIQDVQDVQEAPVEEVELVAEKPAEEKPEPVIEEQPVSKRAPPPLPPKPDHLKERLQKLREEKPSTPEPDNYDVLDDLLSDSDSITADLQQPEPPAESSTKSESLADSKSSTEPIVETASELPIPEPDTELEVDRDPEPKEGTQAHWTWQE
ncbi:uncharacterized protein OCT59_009975 [Rhizophagus irregularis]|uniref:uncharacterized protein n=1 Tax=Rhizophagus irregularis TaxID=588596 RepID=UPI00331AA3E7|nr:hypothetical protein OCT59_009975 [Rhizophagus irregularis]